MPIPFEKYNYLKLKDLERCPYLIGTLAEMYWSRDDQRRMLLIALERYADDLQNKRHSSQTDLRK